MHLPFLFLALNIASQLCAATKDLVACGSSTGSVSDDGRQWNSDLQFLDSINNRHTRQSEVVTVQYNWTFPVPKCPPFLYGRFLTLPVMYTFGIESGPLYWLRFYFYPYTIKAPEMYPPSSAIVSVVVQFSGRSCLMSKNLSLISDLPLLQEMQARHVEYVFREFIVNLNDSEALFLTVFRGDTVKGSYAIINGIELISISPDRLLPETIPQVGVTSSNFSIHGKSLQTMVRLNVGGPSINSAHDNWNREWKSDIPYYNESSGNATITIANISYGSVKAYTAPLEVYTSARLIANRTANASVQSPFNLTWVISVDPSFMYFVRFHFCDFDLDLNCYARSFNIYINRMIVWRKYSICAKAGGKGLANIFDVAVDVDEKSEVLLIELGAEGMLNGLEVFKVENLDGNLARRSSHPDGSVVPPLPVLPPSVSSRSVDIRCIAGGVAGTLVAAAVIIITIFFIWWRLRKSSSIVDTSNGRNQVTETATANKSPNCQTVLVSLPNPDICRHFSLNEIAGITASFDEARVIGEGGFGKVYKAVLEDGTKVAVKRGNRKSGQGEIEFQTEIEILSKVRHKHLVSLIGHCKEGDERILVYEYMENGPLRNHLYSSVSEQRPPLSWEQRLSICIGAAKGLHYLHIGATPGIIHRDMKTTNILLDENMEAKVADFGLCKARPAMDHTHISTGVKGSFGYLDPEYFRLRRLTEKSDVYSFGVILMEVLCARPAVDSSLPHHQVSLAEWAKNCQSQGRLSQIVDPVLAGEAKGHSIGVVGDIAAKCLMQRGNLRPSMGYVLWKLEYALQLQSGLATHFNQILEEEEPPLTTNSIIVSDLEITTDASQNIGVAPRILPHDGASSSSSSSASSMLDPDVATLSQVFNRLIKPHAR